MEPITSIPDMRTPIRCLCGDHEAPYAFPDSAVDAAAIHLLKAGRLTGYAYQSAGSAIVPAITEPNIYALLATRSALLLAAGRPDRSAFRTRAYSESTGGRGALLALLEQEIHQLEAGTMFHGWSSFGSWLMGSGGLEGSRLWRHLMPAGNVELLPSVPISGRHGGGDV